MTSDRQDLAWDYVIVGSGAGGGTLAARLVECGKRVFLLEAGNDPVTTAEARMPEDYEVPGFHAFATENPAMSWNFKVRHYSDEQRQALDPKYEPGKGILYPRAAALGGCTAHNAMIFMLPHDSDWDHIAEVTGDNSWLATKMQRYVKLVEACHHRPWWRFWRYFGINLTGHGWDGWLNIEKALPHEALSDDELVKTVVGTARTFIRKFMLPLDTILRWLWDGGDPNTRRLGRGSHVGLCYTPMSTKQHRRVGARERLLAVAAKYPGRLHIELDALATRVIFADDGISAVGVEYLKGKHLYRAHQQPTSQRGELREIHARHEVILCGGAFNSPQLLMLSGVGPAQALHAHNIAVRVDLPGVGRNLQDRYEVAVTNRMQRPWEALEGARFDRTDALYKCWQEKNSGMYTSNGAVLAIINRSEQATTEPDIFCMALMARFEGYFTGFSKWISGHQDYLTWAVLKAHTNNCAGTITLRSSDPLDTPLVNFRYFEEGNDSQGQDLQAVVEGIKLVRSMAAPLVESGLIAEEMSPGANIDSDQALADYVRNTAWGHHASCSCAIGPVATQGVLNSNFEVHGTRNLRVVDASVFPRIPGFFVVSAVYMIAEKAADVILQAAQARQTVQ